MNFYNLGKTIAIGFIKSQNISNFFIGDNFELAISTNKVLNKLKKYIINYHLSEWVSFQNSCERNAYDELLKGLTDNLIKVPYVEKEFYFDYVRDKLSKLIRKLYFEKDLKKDQSDLSNDNLYRNFTSLILFFGIIAICVLPLFIGLLLIGVPLSIGENQHIDMQRNVIPNKIENIRTIELKVPEKSKVDVNVKYKNDIVELKNL
jgi:hypothetical protein